MSDDEKKLTKEVDLLATFAMRRLGGICEDYVEKGTLDKSQDLQDLYMDFAANIAATCKYTIKVNRLRDGIKIDDKTYDDSFSTFVNELIEKGFEKDFRDDDDD